MTMDTDALRARFDLWRDRLSEASARWGGVTLCAVTKTVPPEVIDAAWDAGARLIGEGSVKAITEKLMPLATLITPNLPEAEFLCGNAIEPNAQRAGDAKHAEELAKRLYGKFGCAVLVKGGHGNGGEAVDVLYDGKATRTFAMDWVREPVSTHGTGCSLAAALAAEIALGAPLDKAVEGAKNYVHKAIEGAYLVGENCGVLGFCRMV